MDLSNSLYEKHKDEWMDKTPESGIYWVGWLIAEVGEIIDVIKKKGVKKIMNEGKVREEMLKEIIDCYMYLADILNRFEYEPKEFSKMYEEKMSYNLSRVYDQAKMK